MTQHPLSGVVEAVPDLPDIGFVPIPPAVISLPQGSSSSHLRFAATGVLVAVVCGSAAGAAASSRWHADNRVTTITIGNIDFIGSLHCTNLNPSVAALSRRECRCHPHFITAA